MFNLKFYLSLLTGFIFIAIHSAGSADAARQRVFLMPTLTCLVKPIPDTSNLKLLACVCCGTGSSLYCGIGGGLYCDSRRRRELERVVLTTKDPETGGTVFSFGPPFSEFGELLFLPKDKPRLDGKSFLAPNLPE